MWSILRWKAFICLFQEEKIKKKIFLSTKNAMPTWKNIHHAKNRKGDTEWFVAHGPFVCTGPHCLWDHLLSRYPIQFYRSGLLLIISSVVCQGQRFAFSPRPLKNWVTPIISPCGVCCRLTAFSFHKPRRVPAEWTHMNPAKFWKRQDTQFMHISC